MFCLLFLFICVLFIEIFATQILNVFGINTNVVYKFFTKDGVKRTFVATGLINYGTIFMRIYFSSIILFAFQPTISSFAYGTSNSKIAILIFTFDKFLIELPLTIIFAYLGKVTNNYIIFIIGFIIMDVLNFIFMAIM